MKKIIKLLLTIPLITTPFFCFSCSENKNNKLEIYKTIQDLIYIKNNKYIVPSEHITNIGYDYDKERIKDIYNVEKEIDEGIKTLKNTKKINNEIKKLQIKIKTLKEEINNGMKITKRQSRNY